MTSSHRLPNIFALLFLLLAVGVGAQAAKADEFADAVKALDAKSFNDKQVAIDQLAALGDARALPVLGAMLEGTLFRHKKSKRIVFGTKAGKGWAITSVLEGEDMGEVGKRRVKKISINNRLRNTLRLTIASLGLTGGDAKGRSEAALGLIKNGTADILGALDKAIEAETDEAAKKAQNIARAAIQAKAGDEQDRISAIGALSGVLNTDVMVVLGALVQDEGAPAAVRQAAADTLSDTEAQGRLYAAAETIFFGISLGSVLLLAAVGLAITFGVMGVINMAHGEMIMLGAYTTWVVQQLFPQWIEASLLIAVPAAFLVSGAVGVAIERGVIRFLYGRPLETLLATFGISLILQQAVRVIFSPLNRSVVTPEWMSGAWEVNAALSLTYNRLTIVAFTIVLMIGIAALLRFSSFGLQMRAVTQNRPMASAMGIRTNRIDALTFGFGSGIAGIAGVALSQLTNVGPNLGQQYIVDSFMVVVFGGVGNLWGTTLGAMILGVANKLLEPWSGAVLGKILVLVFIILFIQKRPSGMFALKGRAAES